MDLGAARVLPQEVIQGALTQGWLGGDLVMASIPANRVLPETQELLFVPQHATIVGVTDVIRVGQPLHVIMFATYNHRYIGLGLTHNLKQFPNN